MLIVVIIIRFMEENNFHKEKALENDEKIKKMFVNLKTQFLFLFEL